MLRKFRELIVGKIHTPEHPELDERERQVDAKLAHAYGKTLGEISRDARRRALRIEVDSMRRR